MAAMKLLLVLFIFLCLGLDVTGQMMQPNSKKYHALMDDIPFITCDVCQIAIKHIKKEVDKLQSNSRSKIDEDGILNVVESSCNPDHKWGDWITRYDIIESGGVLKVLKQESPSKCKQECKTIAKACEESIAEVDTDLGELLWKDSLTLSKLINKVCYKMTTACSKKPPKYRKGKRKDEIFMPMSEDEKKAYDMMKQMKSMQGMPGMEMYSKEDLANMQNQMSDSESSDQLPKQKSVEENFSEKPLSSNLGFFETIKIESKEYWVLSIIWAMEDSIVQKLPTTLLLFSLKVLALPF
eukprot:gene8282-9166_t